MLVLSFIVATLHYISGKKYSKTKYDMQLNRHLLDTYYMIPQLKLRWLSPLFGILFHFLILQLIFSYLSYLYIAAFILIEISSYFYGYYVHSLLGIKIFVEIQLVSLIIHYIIDLVFVGAFILSDQSILSFWFLASFHLALFLLEFVNLVQNIGYQSGTPHLSDLQKVFYIGNSKKEIYIATQNKSLIQIIRISKDSQFKKIEYSQKKTMSIDSQTVIESVDSKRNILITRTDNSYFSLYSLPNLEFKFSTPLYKKNCIRIWDEKGDVIYVSYRKSRKTTDLDILNIEDKFEKGISLELTANFQHKEQLIFYGDMKVEDNKFQKYIVACNHPSYDIITINLEKSEIDILYKNSQENSIKFKISEHQILLFNNKGSPKFIILDAPSNLKGRINDMQILSGFYPIQVKNLDYYLILYPVDSNKIDYFFLAKIQNNSLKIVQRFKTFNSPLKEIIYDPILNILITLTYNKLYFLNIKSTIIIYEPNNEIQLNISI